MPAKPSYKDTTAYKIADAVMTKMKSNADLKAYGFKTWKTGVFKTTPKTSYPLFAVWADPLPPRAAGVGGEWEYPFRVVIIFGFHAHKKMEDDLAHAEFISAKVITVHTTQYPDNYSSTDIDYTDRNLPFTSWQEAENWPNQKSKLIAWRMITFDVLKRS